MSITEKLFKESDKTQYSEDEKADVQSLNDVALGDTYLKIRNIEDLQTNIYKLSDFDDNDVIGNQYQSLIKEIADIDTDVLIESVGAEGSYQKSLIALLCFIGCISSFSTYQPSLAFISPDFYCPDISCTESEFCLKYWPDNYTSEQIDWKYNSLIKQHNMICDNMYLKTYSMLINQILVALIPFIPATLSDTFGRVKMIKISMCVLCPFSFLGYLFPDTLALQNLSLITAYSIANILNILMIIIMNEISSSNSKLRVRGISFFLIFQSVASDAVALLSYVIIDINIFILAIATADIILLILMFFFLRDEPPKWIYKKGLISEYYKILAKISKKNKTNKSIGSLQNISKINKDLIYLDNTKCVIVHKLAFKQKIQSMKQGFRIILEKGYLSKIICMTLIAGALYINFNAMTFNGGDIGLSDFRINIMFMSSVTGCIFICSSFVIPLLPRKCCTIFSFLFMTSGAVMLYIFRNIISDFKGEKLLETMIVSFILKGGMSFELVVLFVYITELFPTSIRGTANSIIVLTGKLIALSSVYLINFSVYNLDTNPMVACGVMCLFVLPFMYFLPETKGRKID